jgi:hypothetical protein
MQVFRSLGSDDDPFAGATDDLVEYCGSALRRVRARGAAHLAIATHTPLVIVLDDLHAADVPSLLLLLLLSASWRARRC